MILPVFQRQSRDGHCAAAFSLTSGLAEVVVYGGKDMSTVPPLAETTILQFGEEGKGRRMGRGEGKGKGEGREGGWEGEKERRRERREGKGEGREGGWEGEKERGRERREGREGGWEGEKERGRGGRGRGKRGGGWKERRRERRRGRRENHEKGFALLLVYCYLIYTEYKKSHGWVLINIAKNNQRGTLERVRDKMVRMTDTACSMPSLASASNDRTTQLEKRLEESEQQVQMLRRRLEEIESVPSRLEESEQHIQVVEEAERTQSETQWVVRREEIQLTGPELGRGGWATVSVATFRGVQVAAKCIHHQIVSQYNRHIFRREMNMAARIRHPNLVQFIGATVEGEMIILTELMPTSLRKELEKSNDSLMSPAVVSSIGLDVAKALNYLHLMQPDPIIHRDISSANVLLEPLPLGRWRAKVTDYGSVNLQQQLETVGPGNPTYAAPEANDPRLQCPKMDIFSLGILLLETLTGEFPSESDRSRLMGSVNHPGLLELIQRCLSQRKEDRPTASDIISELNNHNMFH